jgi:hypothetical protein
MRANQNFSPEFGLCPKINPKSLSSNSVSANKTTREIDDKNSTQKRFISSPVFHRTPGVRVREITAGVKIELGNLESLVR